MHNFTNIQYHNIHSKTLVFALPWARWSCNSKSQTDIMTYFINQWISFISMNYHHQDNSDPFTMAMHYYLKKEELVAQIKEFRESINTHQYENIILIGTSLGGVLFNQIIDYFGERAKQLFIIGYLTWYIDSNKLITPTIIIQWAFDKYGGINKVQWNIVWNSQTISYHEIPNADHSFYDVNNPNIRYINQVNEIIKSEFIKSQNN